MTDEIIYLTADREDEYIIAQANTQVDPAGNITSDSVVCRYAEEYIEEPALRVQLMDVSPKQIVSVATALIPFLEHDDANRALMGANMQRQAVPLLRPDSPIVGTGMEYRAAKDSGSLHRFERRAATVVAVDAKGITLKHDDGTREGLTTCSSSCAPTPARASTSARSSNSASVSRRGKSSPTARRPTKPSWRSARTCSSRSCRGKATTTKTRS